MKNSTIETDIVQFWYSIIECVRLITKETSNNVFSIEADFNEALNISIPKDDSTDNEKNS